MDIAEGGGEACPQETDRPGLTLSPQYIGLGAVADCVDVNVTVGGQSCQHEIRGDVVICPLPPTLPLGKDGAPLQVGSLADPSPAGVAGVCGLDLNCHLPQVCVDGECQVLGRVVRPGPGGPLQRTLLGVLLALVLLVALLAVALVFNYRRRKQLGELPTPGRLSRHLHRGVPQSLSTPPGQGSASRSWARLLTRALLPQPFLRTWTTWHLWTTPPEACLCLCSGQALTIDMALVRRGPSAAGPRPALPTPPPLPTSHSLSSAASPTRDGRDATCRSLRASSSDSRDGSCVPLLRTKSIQLADLDPVLLAEVKDVLIPHERVITHTDRVIGKGVGPGQGGWDLTQAQGTVGQDCRLLTFLGDLGHTKDPL